MKYVALLRGINVGGNNPVPMSELKTCFEKLGFQNVTTYINSGNVLFESTKKDEPELVVCIENGLKKTFGFPVPVVIRTAKNIAKVVKCIPDTWANDTEQKSDVLFLRPAYDSKQSLKLIKATAGIDTMQYIDGAILWNVPRAMYGKSGMAKFVGTELYKNVTARNVNTVRKLHKLLQEQIS